VVDEQLAAYRGVRVLQEQAAASLRRIVRGLFGLQADGD